MDNETEFSESMQNLFAKLLKNAFSKVNTIMEDFDPDTFGMNFGNFNLSGYKIFGDNYESFQETLEEFGECLEDFIEATVGSFTSFVESVFDCFINVDL